MAEAREIPMKWDRKLGAYTREGNIVERDTSSDPVQLMKPRSVRSSFGVVNKFAMWSITAFLAVTAGFNAVALYNSIEVAAQSTGTISIVDDNQNVTAFSHKGCICETFDVAPNGTTLRVSDHLRYEIRGPYVVFSEMDDTSGVYLTSTKSTERMAKFMYPDFKDDDIVNGLLVTPESGVETIVSICKRQTNTR